MVHVEIVEEFRLKVNASGIRHTAETVMDHADLPQTDTISIIVASDQKIHQLNKQFRMVDSPTDVLSFPGGFQNPEDGTTHHGDVIVSFPMAEAQADERGHSVDMELQFLVVHGILHLLGHDHIDIEDKNKMWAVQRAVFKNLDLPLDIID